MSRSGPALKWLLLFPLAPLGLVGQEATNPAGVVAEVRQAWLDHDFAALVATSDTMRLQLPGIGRVAAVRPPHAARVLRDYLRSANEIAFELRHLRTVSADHVYAQMVRRYVVQGTSDERVETVFLGFRYREGIWRLREVRITP